METKFTKGEWEVVGNGIFPKCKSSNIAIVSNYNSLEESEANAKLIAAAPELLEALIQISESYKYCVKNFEKSEFYINAINAINKATK